MVCLHAALQKFSLAECLSARVQCMDVWTAHKQQMWRLEGLGSATIQHVNLYVGQPGLSQPWKSGQRGTVDD